MCGQCSSACRGIRIHHFDRFCAVINGTVSARERSKLQKSLTSDSRMFGTFAWTAEPRLIWNVAIIGMACPLPDSAIPMSQAHRIHHHNSHRRCQEVSLCGQHIDALTASQCIEVIVSA